MKVNVEKSAKYTNKMKSMQNTINSMKEQFNRDIKNLLKKNEESIAKIEQQHEAAKKKLTGKDDRETAVLKGKIRRLKEVQEKFTADRDRLKQLLDNQKRRSTDIENKFDRDTKNLRKKSEQYESALRKLNERRDIEVAALKNEIKRLGDLD
nr:unnamed protein product [Callosobruchus chinensis]